ncbi:MAG: hypothetical protein P8177_10075 [Gemmatimonadota bacterium]|jgi:hypothetical protein
MAGTRKRSAILGGSMLGLLLPLMAGAACGTSPPPEGPEVASSGPGKTVIEGRALEDGRGSVLDVIRGKTPSLRVRQDVGKCPRITLRNDVSFLSQVNPTVYVDGTRAGDTCILESIRGSDVKLLEIYPRGVTTRPGYGMHAHGLILLFMRS